MAVAAVDCGATSIRVSRVDLDVEPLVPQVVHRVAHSPRRDAVGSLRWDWESITAAVVEGLERCLELGPLDSIGIDTWAVDYGLLDESGQLLSAPYSYRDHRTDHYMELVNEFGSAQMYAINGLQLQPFNTIFQLAYHDREELARASRLLWLPELMVHHLTGTRVTERTSAGSSGLVDLSNGNWSPDLLAAAGVDSKLLGEIVDAGSVVGRWRDVPVTLVGGHDTASAVAGMGQASSGGSAFVATGTWMLVGVERDRAITTAWARERNFTNEAGALGGVRFLRNLTGFWLLEQCRPDWGNPDLRELVRNAGHVSWPTPIIDVGHESLRLPEDMLGTYTALAGIPRTTSPAVVTRSIIESIATATTAVIDQLAEIDEFDDLIVFGGAARMDLLVQRIAQLTQRTVRIGSAEAATLGNAIVQGVAIGTFGSVDEGRQRVPTRDDPGD